MKDKTENQADKADKAEHHQHLHKKQHRQKDGTGLPHLHDALHPETGKPDVNALKGGVDAWWGAIERGEFEIVSATEVGVDETTDVLVVARKKL